MAVLTKKTYNRRTALQQSVETTIGSPVVQGIVSFTSSLMTNLLTDIPKVFSNILIFFWKNVNVFAIFQDRNFNVTLSNNFVKF